jgi:hypothetical protein
MPKLIDGKVWVPIIPTPETDGAVGDAMVELSPGDPDYEAIKAWLEKESLALSASSAGSFTRAR